MVAEKQQQVAPLQLKVLPILPIPAMVLNTFEASKQQGNIYAKC